MWVAKALFFHRRQQNIVEFFSKSVLSKRTRHAYRCQPSSIQECELPSTSTLIRSMSRFSRVTSCSNFSVAWVQSTSTFVEIISTNLHDASSVVRRAKNRNVNTYISRAWVILCFAYSTRLFWNVWTLVSQQLWILCVSTKSKTDVNAQDAWAF